MRPRFLFCLALAPILLAGCGEELPPESHTANLDCPSYWRELLANLPDDAVYAPGHISIKFRSSVSQADAVALVADMGLSSDTTLDLLGGFVVCVDVGDEERWAHWFTHGPIRGIVEYAERVSLLQPLEE